MLQTSTQGAAVADRLTVGVAARLSRYLQVLTQAKKMGKDRISSQEISDYTNVNATQIRRDLSAFGKFGKRGVGYNIDSLLAEIRKILRTQGQHNIALVGAGRLGQAIGSSSIFAEHGINIAAVFDTDAEKVGRRVGHVEVSDYAQLPAIVRDKNIIVGVLAGPPENGQAAVYSPPANRPRGGGFFHAKTHRVRSRRGRHGCRRARGARFQLHRPLQGADDPGRRRVVDPERGRDAGLRLSADRGRDRQLGEPVVPGQP